jgi:hypothetical protein
MVNEAQKTSTTAFGPNFHFWTSPAHLRDVFRSNVDSNGDRMVIFAILKGTSTVLEQIVISKKIHYLLHS